MKNYFIFCLITFLSLNCVALKFQYTSSQSRDIASTNDFQLAAKTLVDFSEKCGLQNDIAEFKSCAQSFFQSSLSEKSKSKMSYFLFSNKSSAQLRKCNKKEIEVRNTPANTDHFVCFDSKENNLKGLIQMDSNFKISNIQNI